MLASSLVFRRFRKSAPETHSTCMMSRCMVSCDCIADWKILPRRVCWRYCWHCMRTLSIINTFVHRYNFFLDWCIATFGVIVYCSFDHRMHADAHRLRLSVDADTLANRSRTVRSKWYWRFRWSLSISVGFDYIDCDRHCMDEFSWLAVATTGWCLFCVDIIMFSFRYRYNWMGRICLSVEQWVHYSSHRTLSPIMHSIGKTTAIDDLRSMHEPEYVLYWP